MARQYVKGDNAIILAVTPANAGQPASWSWGGGAGAGEGKGSVEAGGAGDTSYLGFGGQEVVPSAGLEQRAACGAPGSLADLATSDALRMAREVDPTGERTIGGWV